MNALVLVDIQNEVAVCGLATDYCVKATACDAASLGLRTQLIQEACRGVGLRKDDIPEALDAMRRAGVITGHQPLRG